MRYAVNAKSRKALRLIAAGLTVAALAACSIPFKGEREVAMESEGEFQKMRNSMAVSGDVAIRSYVYCIADAIIAELDEPYRSLDWDIEIFDNEAVNAFAMPGGKIGVFTGILKVAENQDQLGAVIGHEVAHVTEQHAVERYNQAMTTQIGAETVGIFGSIALGGDVRGITQMAAQVALTLPYGRGQESEADTVGLVYSADAGFDPRASVTLWKNMAKANEGAPPEFLSTHPSSDTRIQDLIAELPEALNKYNNALDAGKKPNCKP
jgi:predicted Zn-dependent protease